MKKQEIKKLTKSEALKNIEKLKKDLFNFRFQKINSQVTNPAKIGETKRVIAKLKTLLKEKMPKVLKGIVVSDKPNKTITVMVERKYSHPLLKKVIRVKKNIMLMMKITNIKLGIEFRLLKVNPFQKIRNFKLWRI